MRSQRRACDGVAKRHGRRADRGNNGCRVGESILETGTSQNLSRGSDSLNVHVIISAAAIDVAKKTLANQKKHKQRQRRLSI